MAWVSGWSNLRFMGLAILQGNACSGSGKRWRQASHGAAIRPAAFPARCRLLRRLVPAVHRRTIYNSTFMDLGLKDRVALVAASSQGLGLATAEAFAAEGCRVAMCARNQQALEAGGGEDSKSSHGVDVFTEAFDVTDAAAVSRFVAAVASKFGSVDICVTNAGGPPAKGFLAATLEDWQKAIDANFLSTVYFAREVIPHMQRSVGDGSSRSRRSRPSSRWPIWFFRMRCGRR